MNANLFVREHLAATRAGIPDAIVEVDGWLDRLRDLLDAGPETADEAYDLLALWGKLRRVRPELLTQLDGDEILTRANRLLADRGPELATEALTIPNPAAWLEETAQLEAAYEEPVAPETRSELAERLLSDLDDADLVLDAARRLGQHDSELESELDRCHQWLAENTDLFLAASVHVQAVGLALRPDLPEQDYGLAVTAFKYSDLLWAAEVAEAELALSNIQPLAPEVVGKLAALHRQERQVLDARNAFMIWAAAVRGTMRARAVARAGQEPELEPLRWWQWTSPAGDFTARLTIPPQPVEEETVVLELVERTRPATGLAGQPVTLHGVEATIDPNGRAIFPLIPLLETQEPLRLRIGPEQTEWNLVLSS